MSSNTINGHIDGSVQSTDVADGPLVSILTQSGIRQPKASTTPYASCYNMDHTKRGSALIFNHKLFAKNYMPDRRGTNVDREGISNCLTGLGFKVKLYDDLELNKIEKVLAKVAEKNHGEHDCLVVVVLTHERDGELCAFDRPYNCNIIWSNFTADKCSTLASKPKIFFVQACRSNESIAANRRTGRTSSDGRGSVTYRIPIHSDILIVHSTVPGFYNPQYERQGSWFIRELCSELNRNGTKLNLLVLLTSVCRRVADHLDQRFENYNLEGVADEEEEIPNFTTMLTRLIVFEPKIEAAAASTTFPY